MPDTLSKPSQVPSMPTADFSWPNPVPPQTAKIETNVNTSLIAFNLTS
jgi:hypothetical protein